MSNIYFIGDLHLGHKNIMTFGQRDYSSIEEHDTCMIELWNSVVRHKKDMVWVLGDVAMQIESLDLLKNANGRKRLIMGNHDRFDIGVYQKYFEDIRAYEKRYGFVMSHVPIHPRELEYRSWKWNVHGHLHAYDLPEKNYINVNADRPHMHHSPVSLEWVLEDIKIREARCE